MAGKGASADRDDGDPAPPRRADGFANPSAVIAAEIALARLAQEKGQWTAFAETAAPDALLFVPQPVAARDWLKKRANPPAAITWQTQQVWISCDGSLAATRGAWQNPDGRQGYFTTVWQRQDKGEYKWVMHQSDALPRPLAPTEMISASVASCKAVPPSAVHVTPVPGMLRGGSSGDGSFYWSVRVDPQCGRIVVVRINRGDGKGFEEVLNALVAPPPGQTCTE